MLLNVVPSFVAPFLRGRLGALSKEEDMDFIIGYGPFVVLAAFALAELATPARAFPRLRFWRIKGALYFGMYLVLATVVPQTVDRWLGPLQLFDASGLWLGAQTLLAVLALQVVSYGWHRAMHRVPLLWRWFHQMHHSAERIDVFGAFLFHPLDVVGFSVMGSVALVLLVGVSPVAAGLANVIVFAAVVFGHTNVRTARWLGYFVQRPENHGVHHQRGVHAYNYADFSIIDIVFGTFRNPETWQEPAGFYDGASQRVGEMLSGRDVSKPPATERGEWAQPEAAPAQLGS
jgi:sterol desaturase/sphingolipid hydroxylase (fatty acid hydroxylase superfamily)